MLGRSNKIERHPWIKVRAVVVPRYQVGFSWQGPRIESCYGRTLNNRLWFSFKNIFGLVLRTWSLWQTSSAFQNTVKIHFFFPILKIILYCTYTDWCVKAPPLSTYRPTVTILIFTLISYRKRAYSSDQYNAKINFCFFFLCSFLFQFYFVHECHWM